MRLNRTTRLAALAAFVASLAAAAPLRAQDEFQDFLRPLFASRCNACHGREKIKGKINLHQFTTAAALSKQHEVLHKVIEAVEFNEMPPEGETPLTSNERSKLLSALRGILSRATQGAEAPRTPYRRLNRFQYNHAVRDLFQIDRDIFALPEKMMSRKSRYLTGSKMPDSVEAVSQALEAPSGLAGVRPFPQDLRALHGFDNQADQLSLSPLLLDTFFKLSVSIVESPDFKKEHVGVWNELFGALPSGAPAEAEAGKRLKPFLRRAFRKPVEAETVERYAAYVAQKVEGGLAFPEAMKKAASAVLCSPLFLHRYRSSDPKHRQHELAADLSFFLWGSGPDDALLDLADRGELSKAEVLNRTIDRMLADPKIERFCDSFPAQWMQLETALSVAPDPKRYPYYHADPTRPAALQMVLEPLLLFDAVFVENRPITELIQPPFHYRNAFLEKWYKLEPPPPPAPVVEKTEAQKRADAAAVKRHEAQAAKIQSYIDKLTEFAKKRALLVRRRAGEKLADDAELGRDEVIAAMTSSQKKRHDRLQELLAEQQSQIAALQPRQDPQADPHQASREALQRALRDAMQSNTYRRVAGDDPRFGGIITNAAALSMTSLPTRTRPITRGAWVVEVIFNDPPPPPPNDVPPLNENQGSKKQTIREKFEMHRRHPDCAGCHARIDPLGFALENFDVTGRWRDTYDNGRKVDAGGTLMKKHKFTNAVDFKQLLVREDRRFAKAFTAHLLRFALSRELTAADQLAAAAIVDKARKDQLGLKSLVRQVILSEPFAGSR